MKSVHVLLRSSPLRAVHARARRFGALCGFLVAGCATYGEKTALAYRDFEAGRFEEARVAYADPKTTDSPFLSGAEAGMAALVGGDFEAAKGHFETAYAEVRELEDRALVSATDLGESLVSFAINDTFKAYQGEGFERVMLHACLAITYLGRGELEGAYVEARRANKLLESEEALYEKQYAAGGLGHFLSALAYEMLGEPGEAFIDYQRMMQKGLGGDLAARALIRLAPRLDRESEVAPLVERFGPDPDRPDDSATIVLIAGVGSGPYKQEAGISIPIDGGKIVQWVVPVLATRPQPVTSLLLRLGGGSQAVRTTVIEDVTKVSKENLDDRIAWLAAKSAVRAVLKYKLTEKLEDEHGVLGLIAGDIFTVVTERADLRAWQTLPDTWQAARAFVPPGVHALVVDAEGGESVSLGDFELAPNETLIVVARSIGTRVWAHAIGGHRLAASAPEPNPEHPQTPEPTAANP
ncbi:MAG: hypothetical protein L6Q99_15830 [Planctomycetes bacterium]|nr:hypothetical protein [Planctomycetota bacterium]